MYYFLAQYINNIRLFIINLLIFIYILCKIKIEKIHIEVFMRNTLKKFLIGFLVVAFSFSILCGSPLSIKADETTDWPSGPGVFAQTAVVIDASTGTVLYNKKANTTMYPASITKIMTALLTIENCKMNEKVVFSEYAVNSLSYDDANAACQIGEEMTVKECLYALMLTSANEVATALGEHIAGSEEDFAKMMNERAKKAGAKNTNFVNANGLHDPNHYVTAYDMAMITRAASQYSVFNDIVNSTAFTISKNNKRTESFTSYQRHKMVWPTSGLYYDGIIGGKTGFTDQSGTTLVTYAKRNDMTLICVVLKSNAANVYTDTTSLLDFGFENFSLVNASEEDNRFSDSISHNLSSPFSTNRNSISLDADSSVLLPKGTSFSDLKTSVDFKLEENSFGTITYKYGDTTVGSAKLVYTNNSNSNEESTTEAPTEKKEEITTSVDDTNTEDKPASQTVQEKQKEKTNWTVPIIIIVVVIVIIAFAIIQKRRLDKIRSMKRRRRR